MMVRMTDVSSSPRAESLLNELAAARADAELWGFDLPSEKAFDIATSLLASMHDLDLGQDSVDVAVGEDGNIEITAVAGGEHITVLIAHTGSRTQMVVHDRNTWEVASLSDFVEPSEVVRRIERAAAA